MTDDILTPQAANTLPFQPSTGGGERHPTMTVTARP